MSEFTFRGLGDFGQRSRNAVSRDLFRLGFTHLGHVSALRQYRLRDIKEYKRILTTFKNDDVDWIEL
jgi:hypothetical protein